MKIDPSEYSKVQALLKRNHETVGILTPNQSNNAWLLKPIQHTSRSNNKVTFRKDNVKTHVFHTHITACTSSTQCAYDPPSVTDIRQMMIMSRRTPISVVFSQNGVFVVKFLQEQACAQCKKSIPQGILALQKKMLPSKNYNSIFVRMVNKSCCIRCRWYCSVKTACVPKVA